MSKLPTPPAHSEDSQLELLRTPQTPPTDFGSPASTHELLRVDDLLEDQFEFLDDIHGAIALSRLERDIVDTPEFQRLFRLGQLGFVDLVYPTANHTRGTHSIGVCHWSKNLVDILLKNSPGVLQISPAERVLISLAGLLHDIPHGPFSHDIEKKTHLIAVGNRTEKIKSHYGPYEKHDNWAANPALYVFLNDQRQSVLARVLRRYSPAFAQLLLDNARSHSHLRDFAALLTTGEWPHFETELLAQLLFHLLVFEKPEEASESSLRLRVSFEAKDVKEWGLGPNPQNWRKLHDAWYQPFRHDIVGDTLSADLIDYLMRDQARLGMRSQLDLKLLEYYVLVNHSAEGSSSSLPRFRTALNLYDAKRGTFRSERLNDIFRLLDLRHQIHEKAVYHRVVQSAIAMLARSILMMDKKPTLMQLYGLDGNTPALGGDDRFLEKLVATSQSNGRLSTEAHQSLACKLAERRVYRPLMVVPGDRVPLLLKNLCNFENGLEQPLRQLAAIADSPFFSRFFLLVAAAVEKLLAHAIETEAAVYDLLVQLAKKPDRLDELRKIIPKRVIFWTTPYKQLYKDPAILVCIRDITATLEELRSAHGVSESLRSRISAGIRDAETKNEALWKFYVFLSDGLFYTGALANILPEHPCALDAANHKVHLDAAEKIVIRSLRFAWRYWQDKAHSLDLRTVASTAELGEMIRMLAAEAAWGIPDGISAVKTDQYLHGDDSPTCRDVRYKFDTAKDLGQLLDRVPKEHRETVRQAIRSIGLDTSIVRSEELAEIVSVLAAAPELLPGLVDTAARNSPMDPTGIRLLWLNELRP